ncbi:5-methylthioadenosine/S-adenosylhomocysteine deaminase [Persephonella hydrogeniphila]|uniref:5-methylthioadenosine/S-adenosylhomocysteine deaminase n=1 Tax=Persephonella hydrogeniphila TaxID=198703 RepID=A0A285MYF1_9AQUI|nr:amidohydrolase [Persephonella hydrogeniphila]SNZ02118.1 5-methylthioadenosine/S-adenosylhomocysteine deaminase [Persephonella hydrogeniphila]
MGLKKADIILTDIDYILTMDKDLTEYKNADIVIKDGKIVDIGEGKKNEYYGKTIVCRNKIAIPGMINTHTHAAMTLLRGYGSDNPLKVWLEEYIWPAEGKFVSYEFVRDGTEIAVYEMLRTGTTTFVDMYFYENAVADVIKKVGIRGVLSTGILDFPTPGAKTPDEGIQKTVDFIEEYKNNAFVIPAIGPHAPYTCSPDTLKKAYSVAEKYDVVYHIHIAETEFEVKTVKEKYGKTPVEHLDSIGVLSERTLAAHMVYPSENEIDILSEKGVKVAHCPESNLKLASGIAPVPDMIQKGVTVGIGTDGTASNDNLDIIGEISTAAKLHKGFKKDPTVLNAKEALLMATRWGAQAIRMEDKIGTIEKGKFADIVLIDIKDPHLNPLYDPYTQIVYSSTGFDVDTVLVGGEIKVLNKEVIPLDKDYLLDKARYWKEKVDQIRK